MVENEEFENYSDEDVDLESHNKLLSAVSRIYKKQRVDKPERSEPYSNVSEFHLSKQNGDDKIEIGDLVNVLNKEPSLQKIKNKFHSLDTKSSKLPKPLEKFYADKVKRSVGYEHIKKHVSRWDGIVEKNQTAAQLSFPLKEEPEVKVYQPLEFLHTFKEPTELEKNMAEVLQQSQVARVDSKQEEMIFDLSIPEMIKKRKLMAKLKARESFQIVKTMKQNKIKSKKYRRILRKEKVKQDLKDFETLQRTDPEAALEKLNKIEKERAEERASLRHRNTGKWARAQAIRAKYDVEARMQLAEQIAKSRELTLKNKNVNTESSEDEEDDQSDDNDNKQVEIVSKESDDNPWINEEREQTMDDFISGYQSYWKNKKKEPIVKPTINKAALARLVGIENTNGKRELDVIEHGITESFSDKPKDESSKIETSNLSSFKIDKMKGNIDTSYELTQASNYKVNTSDSPSKNNKNITSKSSLKSHKRKKQEPCNSNSVVETENNSLIDEKHYTSNNLNKNGFETTNIRINERVTNKSGNKVYNSNEFEDEHPSNNKINKNKKKKIQQTEGIDKIKKCIKNISGSWNVEAATDSISSYKNINKSKKNTAVIDNIFDKMESNLHEKIREKLKKLDDTPVGEGKKGKAKRKKSKGGIDKNDDDKRNPAHSQRQINDEICDSGNNNEKIDDVDDLLNVISEPNDKLNSKDADMSKEPMIDPNKFLNVKPRILNAQIPDMLTEGDDVLDDPEDDRRMNISEAFADDDVVNEFSEEKKEEIKSSENQDIDLFLPGWGSWGGPNINLKAQERKRKRFLIKAPKMKRTDFSKPNVIIKDVISDKYKKHLVSKLPDAFTSVRDYEASIRAPIGSTWVPESAVSKLIQPPVVKKMGTVIRPMTEVYLMKDKDKRSKLKINNFDIKDGNKIK